MSTTRDASQLEERSSAHSTNAESLLSCAIDVRCLADGATGGFGRFTYELLVALAKRHDVRIVCLSDQPLPMRLPLPLVVTSHRSELITEQVAWPLRLRQLGVDAIICPNNRGLPLLAPCLSLLVLHDAAEYEAFGPDVSTGVRSLVRFHYATLLSLLSAARVLTVSQASARRISATLGVPRSRLAIIPEAPSATFVATPSQDDLDVRRSLGVHGNYVLFVGGIHPKKDVATLVRAYKRLHGPRPALVLAGSRSHAPADLLAEISAAGAISIAGLTDSELGALYRGCDVFVFPAVAEGYGLPVVEAMACGAPVIVANALSLPEIVGGAGLLFEPGDDVELAGLINSVIADDDLRDRMRLDGMAQVAHLSWDTTADSIIQILRDERSQAPGSLSIARRRLASSAIGARYLKGVVSSLVRCSGKRRGSPQPRQLPT